MAPTAARVGCPGATHIKMDARAAEISILGISRQKILLFRISMPPFRRIYLVAGPVIIGQQNPHPNAKVCSGRDASQIYILFVWNEN